MQYAEVKKLLPLYLEGELEPQEAELVKKFLAQYPDLQKEAHSLQRAWNLLGEAEEIEPSPGYVSRFWTKLAERPSGYQQTLQNIKDLIFGRKAIMAIASACVIVLTVMAGNNYFNAPQEEVYQELAAMSPEELEIVEDIELIENFDLIADLDILENFDVIADMDMGDV